MVEHKKATYKAETPLPVKLKPAHRATVKPPRRDEEAVPLPPAKTGDAERRELILRLINYLESY
jgi:hypothetical protein